MPSCLFCRIGRGELPADVVREDKETIAVLDIHPRAPGHTMVIPRAHRETILDLSAAELHAVFRAVQRVTETLAAALKPHGFTIGINHGKAAGQAVDHLHVHIVPRYHGDGGSSLHGVVDNPSSEPPSALLRRIRAAGAKTEDAMRKRSLTEDKGSV